ncbi:MAG TPA: hypothetical protein VKN99_15215 [Polyangia bacterium]|nr:hypothetical protein [Polyangia bacterium]
MSTFAQEWARPLLVVHALSAAVLVASATHHLIWCRGYLRGRFGRVAQERLFAAVAALAYAVTFSLGLLLYPTYKLHVRAEYLDRADVGLSWVARLFDVKEMWMLVGVAIAGGLFYLSRRAHPRDQPRVAPLYLGLSVLLCLSVWGAALMGLTVVSYRGVGR